MRTQQRDQLLSALQARFEKNMKRHKGLMWAEVIARLEKNPSALASLDAMEISGGEPDVIDRDGSTGAFLFCDCSAESPSGRRSLCYDGEALSARKENKPAGSAVARARSMGIELLTEDQYCKLQQLGEFDLKTSSWIAAPADIRALGGGLFCDRRFGRVFTYHNGVQSYYAGRGFRGLLRV